MKKLILLIGLLIGISACQKEEVETIDAVHIVDFNRTICYKSFYNKIKNFKELPPYLDSISAKHNVEILTVIAIDEDNYVIRTLKKPQPKKKFYKLQ